MCCLLVICLFVLQREHYVTCASDSLAADSKKQTMVSVGYLLAEYVTGNSRLIYLNRFLCAAEDSIQHFLL